MGVDPHGRGGYLPKVLMGNGNNNVMSPMFDRGQ